MNPMNQNSDLEILENLEPAVRPQVLANLLDVTPKTVKNWSKRGLIRVIKVGKDFRIPVSEIQRIMAGEVLNENTATAAE